MDPSHFDSAYEKHHELCDATVLACYEWNRYVSEDYLDLDFEAIDK